MFTPLEIENKRFKKEVFGYSQVEVEDFLTEVSADYEKIYKDNSAALARINMLTDAIKQYKSMEETLQNAMTVAQKSGDEIRAEARESADRIIINAEEQARNIISDARKEAAEASYKLEEIKRSVELFKKQTIELLMAQLEVIKGHKSSAPEFEVSISDDSVASAGVLAEGTAMDLTKVLEDVGKISESIDDFAVILDDEDSKEESEIEIEEE